MQIFEKKDPIKNDLHATLQKLHANDEATITALDVGTQSTLSGLSREEKRDKAIAAVNDSINYLHREEDPDGHTFHSRDPLVGLTQSHLSANAKQVAVNAGDNVIPELQAFGQGNPVVWLPTGVDAILEHLKPKAPFKHATPEKSIIELPDDCKVALLSDWGADNEHAKRLGELAIREGADLVIHLGDIYYSGSKQECEKFLENWPLKDQNGKPEAGRSFALNGNHEMYSLGRYYFTTVLDGLGQEASYFTLQNKWWQLHGFDTAYVPFSISGGSDDDSLRPQWDWLIGLMKDNPQKKNIFLSHNQPVSAHLPEFEQSYRLQGEYRQLMMQAQPGRIFAWFFGHEHRCTIYDDTRTDFKARLIGNGSIPHHPQEEVVPDHDETMARCTAFVEVNKGSLDGGPVAISTFAMLSFSEDKCVVDYINEDGTRFYHQEVWK